MGLCRLLHPDQHCPSLVFSLYWLLFNAFVGANLLQSAFTGFCPLANILKAFGVKPRGETFKY
jgi:hypothetical protein